jgi:hypothetical protein
MLAPDKRNVMPDLIGHPWIPAFARMTKQIGWKEKDAHQYTRFFGGNDSTVIGIVLTGL